MCLKNKPLKRLLNSDQKSPYQKMLDNNDNFKHINSFFWRGMFSKVFLSDILDNNQEKKSCFVSFLLLFFRSVLKCSLRKVTSN